MQDPWPPTEPGDPCSDPASGCNPGGGGDPYPQPEPSSFLVIEFVKPCALKFGNVNSNWQAVGIDRYKIGIHSNVFGDKFIEFPLEIGIPFLLLNGRSISTVEAQNITAIALAAAEREIAEIHGLDFFLSVGAQPKYSSLFATIAQELINASLGVTNAATVKTNISPGTPVISAINNQCN